VEVIFPRKFELSYRHRFEEGGVRFEVADYPKCSRPVAIGYPVENRVQYCRRN
jgi:hypothetical protein